MKNNKKGLTLVELLAVLIVLIIIFLLAVTRVNDISERAENDSVKADATSYLKAINDLFVIKNSQTLTPRYEGLFTYKELKSIGVKVSGTTPTDGYILSLNNSVKYGCFTYKQRKVTIVDNVVKSVGKGVCNIKNGYNSNLGVYVADYSGSEEIFIIPKTGKYLIEAWGAQGGDANEYKGGYGAYSRGYVAFTQGDLIYINVGGSGIPNCTSTCSGGYNGGGSAAGRSDIPSGTGGGATSIASKSGTISNLDKNDIYIIAGGGGGTSFQSPNYTGEGGSGGGYVGSDGTALNPGWSSGTGGTQKTGGISGLSDRGQNGSFGQGGNGTQFSAGGGGGYYGGGASNQSGAGGGSGFLGISYISDAAMYCYNCKEAFTAATKTISVDNYSNTPMPYTAKKGHGYARITFISDASDARYNIFFAPNGGVGGQTASLEASLSEMVPELNAAKPTRNGYVFVGYFDNPDFTNANMYYDYDLNPVKKFDNMSDVTLYAGWYEISKIKYDFDYTGDYQIFVAAQNGTYKFEAWGAQGGRARCNGSLCGAGGKGGYVSGNIVLNKGEIIYVYVGEKGADAIVRANTVPSFNGGGLGTWDYDDDEASGGGGGATDFRLVKGPFKKLDALASRIMVAGGGGGQCWDYATGAGGGINGQSTNNAGATQTTGYSFGIGKDGYGGANSTGVSGAGGGYWGGTTSDAYASGGASGGSGYVSGHTGCVAIKSATNISPKDGCVNGTTNNSCSLHYSGKVFTNTSLIAGNNELPTYDGTSTMTGNEGNGHAKVTFIQ